SRTGVTRQLLWEEYRKEQPQGFGYTQFCHYLNLQIEKKNCVMHFDHKPGEKLMVDFAGKTMSYVIKETGEVVTCQVFVAALAYSGYSYVEAVHSQKQEDFLFCLSNSLHFLEGVPQCILSDNLKSAVKRSNRYEPDFTSLSEQLSVHYDFTLMAARVGKPKDKPHVESAVRTTYYRVYAPLRDKMFFSIEELNEAIRHQLMIHNALPFQRKEGSRESIFMAVEKPLLKPLPTAPFEVKHVVEATVQRNYHVTLGEDWHHYSVPYIHVRERVKIIYTQKTVEVYLNLKRIAFHFRNKTKHAYTTLYEHMPTNHQQQQTARGWDGNYFRREAEKLGPGTLQVIEKALSLKIYPEQTFRTCLGVLRLGNKYGVQRLEAACSRAITGSKVNYRIIKNILENHLDQVPVSATNPNLFSSIIEHENIRGALNYK
ncbi:MAG: IS21 family transposase, partial [Bacteroidota bacterium]